jgi:radical SAM superfamily enzyme YgiQ (UPF0313 family)
MTDIILFQPRCGDWDLAGIRSPTGLLNVANVPVDMGYGVTLIDQRISNDWKKDIKRNIHDARIFGITVMVGRQIVHALEVAGFVKSVKPDILVVVGGSWPQTRPDLCIEDRDIDIVCYGEGDYLLPELMDYLKGKREIKDILGIYYKEDGKIKRNDPRPLVENLDDLPKIPYHLIDPKDYLAVDFRKGNPSISLILSRGCPSRCNFCSVNKISHRRWRGYSVKRILEDLESLEKSYGIKDFYFYDDNIAGDTRFFSEFVSTLAESGKDYNWGVAGIRSDSILGLDDNTMENIVKSGCKNLDVGAESGSTRILKFIRKGEELDTIREANRRLSKYPLIIKYSFVGGFPTETREEFLATLRFKRFLESENPRAAGLIFFYTPFPGTDMFDIAVENGLKPPGSLREWSDFNYNTWYKEYPSWLSRDMISLVESSSFLSYFDNKNLSYKYTNPVMNLMFRIYHPIARFRSERYFFTFFIEKKLAGLIERGKACKR